MPARAFIWNKSNLLKIAPQTIIWLDVEREVVTAGIIQSLSFTHLDKHGIFAINFWQLLVWFNSHLLFFISPDRNQIRNTLLTKGRWIANKSTSRQHFNKCPALLGWLNMQMWLKCSKSKPKRINFSCKCTLNSREKGLIGVVVFPREGILRPYC